MALGFSGSTSEAYPLVLQLTAAVAAFRPAVEEMAREGVPLNIIQRQLGHTDLGVTSIYPQGIDNAEIVNAVHACRAPMMPASAGLRL